MHAAREDYQGFHRRRHRLIRELLERHAPQGARCLDIGGGGDISGIGELLRGRYGELHAVDQGSDVDEGRSRGIEARAVDVDVEPLPYPDGYFDLVLFASVIEHLYNPRHALDEITRVLRPGGVFLVEAPNAVALGRRIDAALGLNPFRWFNRYNAMEGKAPLFLCSIFYTAEEVREALGERFRVVEERYGMHDPPVNAAKRLVREAAWRLRPRLGDCFVLVAQRKG